MKVKDVMKKDVFILKQDDLALDALRILFKKQISGLPVVDEDGKLVGMFTEKDILVRILPTYVEQVGKFIYEENPKAIKKKFLDLAEAKVSQLMRREVVTINEEANACEAAKLMLTRKARRIPVLDESGRMTGIVARSDVLSCLAGEAGISL